MITRLHLKNFRKAEDETMLFTSGINVLRGSNECGKSTRLHAISYALFGARTLPTSLEQAVTWGEHVNSLKVELDIIIDGKLYEYKRSKSGAEVTLDGKVYCTGQSEVSKLSATLLGADANVASKLLMASQNDIRGALSDGPSSMTNLIEELASMSLFDEILEAAQNKLSLGSSAVIEARLEGMKRTLSVTLANLPPKPDEAAREAERTEAEKCIAALDTSLPTLTKNLEDAVAMWHETSQQYLKRSKMVEEVERNMNALLYQTDQAKGLEEGAKRVVDVSQLPALAQQIVEGEDHLKRWSAYQEYLQLPTEGPWWEGSIADFEADSLNAGRKYTQANDMLHKSQKAIRDLQADRLDGGPCSKCGQPTAHLEHIAKTNAEIERKLMEWSLGIDPLREEVAEWFKYIGEISSVRKFAAARNVVLAKLIGYVETDEATYPPRVKWIGGKPTDTCPDVAALKHTVANINAQVRAVESIKAKYELLVEQREKQRVAWQTAVTSLESLVAPSGDEVIRITNEKVKAAEALDTARGDAACLATTEKNRADAFFASQRLWQLAQSQVVDLEKSIKQQEEDLGSLAFNNGLIKKLRAIRPIIANKLWSTVLASVSVMFSQMRGEDSWVTKEKSGFCVNGQAVESLSGSTLDVLGIATRCSLIRTFLPGCELLILDEPLHGCDSNRAEATLGFLKSVNFTQTILVSHDEVSESIADNLILL